eukprot:1150538-Pelagomonas_calceolata.AAC.1
MFASSVTQDQLQSRLIVLKKHITKVPRPLSTQFSWGVGGTCYTEHTLNQFKQLGLDHQRANKLACKLHARSV